jgi:hypothetical protein
MWPEAEATLEDALADLSARESEQLFDLLSRVKETLVAMVEDGPAGKLATAQRARRARHQNGRASP